ncbi:MAG: hypothetical protein KDE03_00010 [Rhodobacteraceae bacterium]|nr:hypothetical protein [Paracoccaceae bacterium]
MTSDFAVVAGLIIVVMFLPRLVAAYAMQRSLRLRLAAVLAGFVLMAGGLLFQPGGPRLSGVPEAVIRIIADVIR